MVAPGQIAAEMTNVYCAAIQRAVNHAVEVARNATGIECIILARAFLDIVDLYHAYVLMASKAVEEAAVRSAARSMFIEADIELIQYLAEQGLVDSGQAQQAIDVLTYEMQRIYDKYTNLRQDFENTLPALGDCVAQAINVIATEYNNYDCAEKLAL